MLQATFNNGGSFSIYVNYNESYIGWPHSARKKNSD